MDEVARTIAALERRQRGRQRMGVLANAIRRRWEDSNRRQAAAQGVAEMGATIAGPHLSKGFANMGELLRYAPEFIGPQADIKDLTDFSRMAGENIRAGNYGTAAINTATAAATVPMMLIPGSVSGIKKGVEAITPGPVYQSRLTKALESMPQETMQTGQLKGYLAKYPGGISADELRHTGVADLLNAPGKVTKTELLNQVKANPLEIKDVVKQSHHGYNYEGNQWQAAIDRAEAAGDFDEAERIGRAWEGLDETTGSTAGSPKYSGADLNLPGGEDYKEVLLTLPQKTETTVVPHPTLDGFALQKSDGSYVLAPEGSPRAGQPSQWEDRGLAERWGIRSHGEGYHGGHYDEPNVLAHARYDTRTVDGDKTLFMQEIQSDWHQAARKLRKAEAKRIAEAEGIDVKDAMKRVPEDFGYMVRHRSGKVVRQDDSHWKIEWDDTGEYSGGYGSREHAEEVLAGPRGVEGVPDAPFKKNWHELTLKRMIREAAETGHDRIAWTPGQVQIDRYDLSKQIDSIEWAKQAGPDGKYKINAVKDGDSVVSKEGLTAAELEEHIGKEAAEKITEGGLNGELSGLDLRVGGEGMHGFYGDTAKKNAAGEVIPNGMMVKAANKYAKKYGVKVEVKKTNIKGKAGGQDIWTLKITPEMKRAILTEGVRASVDQNRLGGGIFGMMA